MLRDSIKKYRGVGSALAVTLAVSIAALAPQPAIGAPQNLEVADGFRVSEVCPGWAAAAGVRETIPGRASPTSIALGKHKEIYVSFMSGQIFSIKLGKKKKKGCEVTPLADLNDFLPEGVNTPMGLAVHPFTGELYVAHQIGFTFPLPGEIADSDLVKSGISILHPDGTLESVLPDGVLLNSMLFEALPLPVSGTQGCDFDHAGNLYCAQGINDKSRERWHLCEGFDDGSDECEGASPSDEWQSGIVKLAADGTVSLWSSGHRSPYDVVVGMEDKHGVAQDIYAGDNGEGEECDVGDGVVGPNEDACLVDNGSKPTIQLYDELNRASYGSFHGFPEGYPPLAVPQDEWKIPETHTGAVWKLGKHPYPDPNNPDTLPNTPIEFYDWPVPTGIDYDEKSWGGFENAVYMALYNCTSTAFDDLGTVEVFHGPYQREHTVLLWNLDGPIDLRMSKKGELYVLQFSDGAIFKVQPE